MTPSQSYNGPTALGYSKYASPHRMRTQPTAISTAVTAIAGAAANNVIATRGQIVATSNESNTSDTQLAVAQGNTLMEAVETHTANLSLTVSTAITNTRRLLDHIRQVVQKEDPVGLKTVDELWNELGALFDAAKGANSALPHFLEKQRNNMAIYHSTALNNTYRETQEELNIQHKKVNLQHNLILEHQQAFENYKASTGIKLDELEALRDRVSLSTLEKGNFRTEMDTYAQLLEKELRNKADELKKTEVLQQEHDSLVSDKEDLLTRVSALSKDLAEAQEQAKSSKQQVIDRYAAELREKDDLLEKQSAEVKKLTALVDNTTTEKNNIGNELGKLRLEFSQLKKDQEQIKKYETLEIDLKRLRKENEGLSQRLNNLSDTERNNTDLSNEKAKLVEEVAKLTAYLDSAKKDSSIIEHSFVALNKNVKKLERENENLVSDQNKLNVIQLKVQQAAATVASLTKENNALKTMIEELRVTPSVPVVTGSSEDNEKKILQEQVRQLEGVKGELEEKLEAWTKVGNESYKKYKDMLPTFRQADQHRKDAADKDEQIKCLQNELSAAKISQSNHVGPGGDATYWKEKYETLLAQVGN